jgi:geranylgeranyl diphosphate synthase type II
MDARPASDVDDHVTADDQAAARRVEALRRRLDDALLDLVADAEPAALYEPVRYVLAGGGKRLRPVLLVLTAEAFGAPVARALPAALAVELFHNFTLVHDDIMDGDDTRRGRPTVHVRWDTSTAILAGDLLMALAYDALTRTEVDGPRLRRLLAAFHPMAERLCAGQALDLAFETEEEVSVKEYLHMIDGKTGALVAAVFALGAVVGGAGAQAEADLAEAGRRVGRAFQIQDDLLDLTADPDRFGRPVGRDLVEGKRSFLVLRALERATGAEHAWFARILTDGGLPEAEVPEARARMQRLGVFDDARAAVEEHSAVALARLDALPAGDAARTVRWLVRRMQARMY